LVEIKTPILWDKDVIYNISKKKKKKIEIVIAVDVDQKNETS